MAVPLDPVDVISAQLAEWDVPHVELSIFGTADARSIYNEVSRFCGQELGSAVAGYHFQTSSVGSTHGMRLEDGRDVVLKVRPLVADNPHLHRDQATLATVVRVTNWLHGQGYPCPAQLAGPLALGRGLATVEAYLQRGTHGDGFEPSCRRAIARGFAELVERLSALPFDAGNLKHFWRGEALYPQPHSKLFDFSGPARLAEAVDELARRARSLEAHGEKRVLGHGDWRVEHLRFENELIVATYDWDSLTSSAESDLLGVAAHGFTADWSLPNAKRIPTGNDILAFVADYEDARGRPFTKIERRSVLARCVYSIAYGTRCQLSGDPERTEWEPDSWPHLLLSDGERLLRSVG